MSEKFEQLSTRPGFIKHNGGLLFREISKTEYEFKTSIKENHLNASGITHGGYIASIVDAGAGTKWSYSEKESGKKWNRSEGLAVMSSLHIWMRIS